MIMIIMINVNMNINMNLDIRIAMIIIVAITMIIKLHVSYIARFAKALRTTSCPTSFSDSLSQVRA